MDHFEYVDGRLHCEGVDLSRIAQEVGTPFYCYSEGTLVHHYQTMVQALDGMAHRICYSVKANGNLAVLDALVKRGAGLDIVSGGELERAMRVGCPAERVVYSGVGKRRDEMERALNVGVGLFNVESAAELSRLHAVAAAMGKKAPVALRVNPDVDAKTHPYISTGLRVNKFGIPHQEALALCRQAAAMEHVELLGLDCHIGSQLTQVAPFVDAVRRIRALIEALAQEGIPIRYLDMGGGLGIPYRGREETPSPADYARRLKEALAGLDVTLILEPGRVIVGNAGVLVTRVEYVKQGEAKRFVIVDAGMNDLMRPALYDAHHDIWPLHPVEGKQEEQVDVVGPICETGDFFARDRLLPPCAEGDLLAIRSAGAYGFSMSGNYNTRPRAAEVMVRGQRFAVVRRREKIEDMLAGESLFPT